MNSPYVKCSVCGNQLPAALVRDRGFITCSCGLRIDCAPGVHARHHLRNFFFLLVTAVVIMLAATIGRRFLG